jgi:hypothetical protein
MLPVLQGHRDLFRFFFGDGWSLLTVVAAAWDKPHARIMRDGTPAIAYRIPRAVVDRYNEQYDDLKAKLRALGPGHGVSGSAFIVPMIAIRAVCAGLAAVYGWIPAMAFSLVQFAVAPYSLFAAIAAWYHVLPLFAVHYAIFALLQTGTGAVLSRAPALHGYVYVPIDVRFILWWIVVDQLICVLFCVWTPIGRPVRYPAKRLVQSVGYGFINSKTYWLVLLLSCRGFEINLAAWLLMAMAPTRAVTWVSDRLAPLLPATSLHWTFQSSMFYHSHRMVHLPGVYAQAHRHHHYLADATPFDADLYGSGLPEEWAKLVTEVAMCMLVGIMPWSLSFGALRTSMRNRIGHTRTGDEDANFHVNHHARHVRNFGVRWFPLDLLLSTDHADVSRIVPGLQAAKQIEGDEYVLVMTSS